MTRKLYWDDSHQVEFSAKVADVIFGDGKTALILDRTAFYPLGGGQPADHGWIDGIPVIDVSIDENQLIYHWITEPRNFCAGDIVNGRIDRDRRRDLLQQHTGQHILSQAFFQLYGAETCGFRINDQISEIDLTFDGLGEEISGAIKKSEDLANTVVFENREIFASIVSPNEAAQLPLRKESLITDCLRIIEIDGFDWSPCGGTHAKRTGEVGVIMVKGWERAKKMLRLHFICGHRVLQDYRLINENAISIARNFSVGRDNINDAVENLFRENRELEKKNRWLEIEIAEFRIQDLMSTAEPIDNLNFIAGKFSDLAFDTIKLISHRLVSQPSLISFLAAHDEKVTRFVLACSEGLSLNMGGITKILCAEFCGKGGGTQTFSQGGIPTDKVDELIRRLREMLQEK